MYSLIFKREIKDANGGITSKFRVVPVKLPDEIDNTWELVSGAHECFILTQDPNVLFKSDLPETVLETVKRDNNATILPPAEPPSVEIITDQYTKPEVDAKIAAHNAIKWYQPGDRFVTPVTSGTAKLIVKNNSIFICYRKGKDANITEPNSVCISDFDKSKFFKACNQIYGSGTYKFTAKADPDEYTYWTEWLEKEYKTQLNLKNQELSHKAEEEAMRKAHDETYNNQ